MLRRRRSALVDLVPLLVLTGCGGGDGGEGAATAPLARGAWPAEMVAAEVAVARAGCARCHEAPAEAAARWVPQPGPDLAEAVRWRADDGGSAFLRTHHGGDAAADLAAWVGALAANAAVPEPVPGSPAAINRGERLAREFACRACHAPAEFDALPARVDHARLAAFLGTPGPRHPGLVHPPLSAAEAGDLASWLLRAQGASTGPVPGFAWTAWQQQIDDEHLPELDGVAPVAQGVADRIDTAPAPRKNHFVLRFDATLDVPATGEWTFALGSDDSSWLWLDGELRVRNEALAPHRVREAKVTLTAGAHDLRVVYTQAAGEATLALRWRGPGVEDQEIPKARATAQALRFAPPPPRPAPAAEAVVRGRAAARQLRCDACHAIADEQFAALPPPPSARAFQQLGDAPCPQTPAGQALRAAALPLLATPIDDRARLAMALQRDGCLRCHTRDGTGGLPPAVRSELAEVEDLGDEGKVPPDLTAVGRRLRPEWLHKVLAAGHSVRPYLRVRMPALGDERAREYAALFGRVDGIDQRPEPPFTVAAAERGRQLAGLGGRNCITCHTCLGHRATGPQGMDLVLQYERLQPAWFLDWCLHPQQLRPGTRMPALWWQDDADARAEIAALRAWSSLGAAAPLPAGVKAKGASTMLWTADRPRLHGAFLHGVSARCLAVGTAERTHFAWDLAGTRLVWLWRGDFLDAGGTWDGRAGKLLKPAGQDWRVLPDHTVNGGAARRLLGQRMTADGFPVLRVACGDAEYEDEVRPRLGQRGSEAVRTLRVVRASCEFTFPAVEQGTMTVGDTVAGRHAVAQGNSLEVVYRW